MLFDPLWGPIFTLHILTNPVREQFFYKPVFDLKVAVEGKTLVNNDRIFIS